MDAASHVSWLTRLTGFSFRKRKLLVVSDGQGRTVTIWGRLPLFKPEAERAWCERLLRR